MTTKIMKNKNNTKNECNKITLPKNIREKNPTISTKYKKSQLKKSNLK